MKVSVVVPVYNAEDYIGRCIESVINQTHKEFELILVDDASYDSSLEICRLYEKKDSRVRVLTKSNGGPHSARKLGVNRAEHPYVMFVDSDDWIDESYIETMIKQMVECELDYLVAGYTLCENDRRVEYENRIPSGIYLKEDLCKSIYASMLCPDYSFEQRIIPALWGKMFKTEIIKSIMNELDDDISIGEDLACTFKYILQVQKIKVLNENHSYHYVVQKTSVSNRRDIAYFEKSVRLGQFLDRTLEVYTLENLRDNIVCYKAFLVYRWIGNMLLTPKIRMFSGYVNDLKLADTELKILLEECDINRLNINILSKRLMCYIKQERIMKFYILSLGLFIWNRIKRRR